MTSCSQAHSGYSFFKELPGKYESPIMAALTITTVAKGKVVFLSLLPQARRSVSSRHCEGYELVFDAHN